jgi:alpha-beta hydrolase superfamily lysophospholipase
LVGRGPVGVVLAHQYPSDLCGFWPFATYLAKRGLRAFAIDLRCFGRSACPEGEAKGRVVDDLGAAAAEARALIVR